MTTANKTCCHCFGLGYDSSGYPCTCVPAKVAKVGRKYRTTFDEPLRHSAWRRQLRTLAKVMLMAVLAALVCAAVIAVAPRQSGRFVSCAHPEIGQDIAVRSACRKQKVST